MQSENHQLGDPHSKTHPTQELSCAAFFLLVKKPWATLMLLSAHVLPTRNASIGSDAAFLQLQTLLCDEHGAALRVKVDAKVQWQVLHFWRKWPEQALKPSFALRQDNNWGPFLAPSM